MGECKLADDFLNDQMDASLIIAQSQLLHNLLHVQSCNLVEKWWWMMSDDMSCNQMFEIASTLRWGFSAEKPYNMSSQSIAIPAICRAFE